MGPSVEQGIDLRALFTRLGNGSSNQGVCVQVVMQSIVLQHAVIFLIAFGQGWVEEHPNPLLSCLLNSGFGAVSSDAPALGQGIVVNSGRRSVIDGTCDGSHNSDGNRDVRFKD